MEEGFDSLELGVGMQMWGSTALNRGGSSLVRQGSHEPPYLSATTHPLESPGSVKGTKLLHTRAHYS